MDSAIARKNSFKNTFGGNLYQTHHVRSYLSLNALLRYPTQSVGRFSMLIAASEQRAIY